ncbi:structural maintenance of chromosomes protein [Anaeramoeba flamelloides]|uniref:Structural maintenance of chromosomes protein n=1 Tax=Anaeramoeba flamelloides TaxID=1746091 RepID=A0AAV7ZGJ1_9EUKA|nr:structural maintenance of chromosomes protein [Anaeramoeba flamelloides]
MTEIITQRKTRTSEMQNLKNQVAVLKKRLGKLTQSQIDLEKTVNHRKQDTDLTTTLRSEIGLHQKFATEQQTLLGDALEEVDRLNILLEEKEFNYKRKTNTLENELKHHKHARQALQQQNEVLVEKLEEQLSKEKTLNIKYEKKNTKTLGELRITKSLQLLYKKAHQESLKQVEKSTKFSEQMIESSKEENKKQIDDLVQENLQLKALLQKQQKQFQILWDDFSQIQKEESDQDEDQDEDEENEDEYFQNEFQEINNDNELEFEEITEEEEQREKGTTVNKLEFEESKIKKNQKQKWKLQKMSKEKQILCYKNQWTYEKKRNKKLIKTIDEVQNEIQLRAQEIDDQYLEYERVIHDHLTLINELDQYTNVEKELKKQIINSERNYHLELEEKKVYKKKVNLLTKELTKILQNNFSSDRMLNFQNKKVLSFDNIKMVGNSILNGNGNKTEKKNNSNESSSDSENEINNRYLKDLISQLENWKESIFNELKQNLNNYSKLSIEEFSQDLQNKNEFYEQLITSQKELIGGLVLQRDVLKDYIEYEFKNGNFDYASHKKQYLNDQKKQKEREEYLLKTANLALEKLSQENERGLKERSGQIKILESEQDLLKKQISNLVGELKFEKSINENLKTNIQEYTNALQQWKNRVNELNNEIKIVKKEIKSYKENKENLNQENNELRKVKNNFKNEIERIENDNKQRNFQIEELKVQLEEEKQNVESIKNVKELNEQRNEQEKLKANQQKEEYLEIIQTMKEKMKKKKMINNKLKSKINNFKTIIKQNEKMKNKFENLQKERDLIKNYNEQLNEKLILIQDNIKKLKFLDLKNNEKQQVINELTKEMELKEQENQTLKRNLNNLDLQYQEMGERLKLKENDLSGLIQAKDIVEEEIRNAINNEKLSREEIIKQKSEFEKDLLLLEKKYLLIEEQWIEEKNNNSKLEIQNKEIMESLKKSRMDLEKYIKLSEEFQNKYDSEVISHSTDVERLLKERKSNNLKKKNYVKMKKQFKLENEKLSKELDNAKYELTNLTKERDNYKNENVEMANEKTKLEKTLIRQLDIIKKDASVFYFTKNTQMGQLGEKKEGIGMGRDNKVIGNTMRNKENNIEIENMEILEEMKPIEKKLIESQKKYEVLNIEFNNLKYNEELLKGQLENLENNLKKEKEKNNQLSKQKKFSTSFKFKDNINFINLEKKIRQLENELLLYKENNSSLRSEINNMLNTIKKSKMQIAKLQTEKTEAVDKLEKNQIPMNVIKESKESLIKQEEYWKNKINQILKHHNNLDLMKEIELENENEKLIDKNKKMEKEIENIKLLHENLNEKIKQLGEQIKNLNQKNSQLKIDDQQKDNEIKVLNEKIKNKINELKNVNILLKKEKEKIVQMKKQNYNTLKMKSEYDEKIKAIKEDEIAFLKLKQKNLKEFNSKRQHFETQIKTLNNEKAQLQREFKNYRITHDNIKKKLEANNKILNQKNQKLLNESNNLNAQIEKTTQIINSIEKLKTNYQQKINESKQLKQSKLKLEQDVNQYSQKLKKSDDQILNYKSRLKRCSQLMNQVLQLHDSVDRKRKGFEMHPIENNVDNDDNLNLISHSQIEIEKPILQTQKKKRNLKINHSQISNVSNQID